MQYCWSYTHVFQYHSLSLFHHTCSPFFKMGVGFRQELAKREMGLVSWLILISFIGRDFSVLLPISLLASLTYSFICLKFSEPLTLCWAKGQRDSTIHPALQALTFQDAEFVVLQTRTLQSTPSLQITAVFQGASVVLFFISSAHPSLCIQLICSKEQALTPGGMFLRNVWTICIPNMQQGHGEIGTMRLGTSQFCFFLIP